jgi:N utilization substance protein B
MKLKKTKFVPKARTAARQRVLQALYQWQITGQGQGQGIQVIESQFLEEQDMAQADIPYFKKLLQGIGKQVDQLDTAFTPFLDRSLTQVDPIELAILRVGSYELKNCPDIPFKVVINEAVELAKVFGAEKSHKYVNGILDKLVSRRKFR